MKMPSSNGFAVFDLAQQTAKRYGEAFIVFVGGSASSVFVDPGAARYQARLESEKVGKTNVKIKRFRV
ncbi:MAG: hypothetical protein WBK51_12420 [Polaromonas sp.]